ncbi:hypothetical protein C479_06092 [Halovivax asiaticus JCM 14624]|uniref:DUF8159 domain-containing protein n=1 Tax=Halovivax asiaticus JCM 14624 TaxID=1227490 RepID=M0BNY0_9EURY|nr:hypothetical protein [Halovivax asiaticus]ELZ11993.1 hypothetical protein C479_06092 [Halovivax asiaticus JCM 14624]
MADHDFRTSNRSRRHLLAGVAGGGLAAIAGCLSSSDDDSEGTTIEPAEPPIEREGTPPEFYYFLEENGIEVSSLERDADVLSLTYESDAATVTESNDEIGIVYQVYRSGLILRGSDVEYLECKIANPFAKQAHSWAIDTEWIHEYDGADDEDDTNSENESTSDMDSDVRTLWALIQRTKTYGDEGFPDGDGNESNESE